MNSPDRILHRLLASGWEIACFGNWDGDESRIDLAMSRRGIVRQVTAGSLVDALLQAERMAQIPAPALARDEVTAC